MENQESNSAEPAYAGYWARVGAYLIDTVIVFIPTFCIALTVRVFCDMVVKDPVVIMVISLLDTLFLSLLYGLYGGLFESSKFQATPGKMVLKIKVTDIEGQRCSFVRAFARYIGMGLSDACFCIGYLMPLWTKKKQCLHDIAANCLVVKST